MADPMKNDDDKGYIVLGQEFEGGFEATHVSPDGISHGQLYTDLSSAPEGVDTKINLERIAGPYYNIKSTEPISRPAMVNSQAYRKNWDNIFGGGPVVGEA